MSNNKSSNPQDKTPEQGKNPEIPPSNDKSKWTAERAIVWFTFALVVTAILQVVIGYFQNKIADRQTGIADRQTNIADKQTKIQEDTLELTHVIQRAWVGVEEIHVNIARDKEIVNAQIVWKNYGKVPAQNLEPSTGLRCKAVDEPYDLTPPKPQEQSRATLFPNAITSNNLKEKFPTSITNAVLDGTAILYVVSLATYDDITGQNHQTTVAAKWDIDIQKWSRLSEGNDAN